MRYLLGSFVALLCSMAVLLLGSGLLGSLLALRMEIEGFAVSTIGLVMACYSVGFVVASLVWGRVITRIGHIRAFAVLAGLAAASSLVYPLAIWPPLWALLRATFGFCLAGLYMVAESWLNQRTPRELRGRILAWYSIVTAAGLGGGQFLLNTFQPSGFELFSLAAALFALALVPVSMTRAPTPELISARPMSLGRIYAASPLALAGAGGAGVIVGAFMALGPVFGRQVGLGVPGVSLLMGGALIGGLLLQWPVGHFSDRHSRSLTLILVAAGLAVVSAAVALAALGRWTVLPGFAAIWGGLAFTLYPLSLSLAADFVAPEELVGAGAVLLMVHGAGMIAGPVVFGWLMQQLGPAAFFVASALAAAALAIYGMRRRQVSTPLPVEEQGHFVQVPNTTPFATALDPRAEEGQLELPLEAQG